MSPASGACGLLLILTSCFLLALHAGFGYFGYNICSGFVSIAVLFEIKLVSSCSLIFCIHYILQDNDYNADVVIDFTIIKLLVDIRKIMLSEKKAAMAAVLMTTHKN